jgi:hypothetical protein
VKVKLALLAKATNRQCFTRHHYRLDIQTNSFVEDSIAGLSLEPAVLVKPTQRAWITNRQCWSMQHCRHEPQTGVVLLDRTLSAWATNRQCWLKWTMPGGAKNRQWHLISLVVRSYRQWCEPPLLPVCHCWFKISQWRGFWIESDMNNWGSGLQVQYVVACVLHDVHAAAVYVSLGL